MSYEARLASAEDRASAVAGTAEARFQAKLLVEVERYQVRCHPKGVRTCACSIYFGMYVRAVRRSNKLGELSIKGFIARNS